MGGYNADREMELRVLRGELAKVLGWAVRFVSQRAQLPILENVVLKAKKTKLTVLATNLEVSLAAGVGAKVTKEGEIAVPARTLTDLVTSVGAESLELMAKKEGLKIGAPGFEARINGMNTADFPAITQTLGKESLRLSEKTGRELTGALEKVIFAVSRDDTRPVLTGVLFMLEGEKLRLVSSDGFRLSQKTIGLGKKVKEGKMIIPRTILTEVPRLMEGEKQGLALELKAAESAAVFEVGGVIVGSRVIEGEFPDFERIMPKTARLTVRVGKEELGEAVKAASVFARESGNVVNLAVTEGEVKVVAESAKSGRQETTVAAKTEGERVEIAYNYRFLEEFLGVVAGDEVEIELTDSASPGVFRDTKDKDYLHLIMPVRVGG